MGKTLQVQKLVPSIIEPDKIGLDIVAALTEKDGKSELAIPGVHFEVRVGVQKVYEGTSDSETGVFSVENIPVGEFGTHFEVVVFADDEVNGLSASVQIDVTSVMAEIERRREAKADDEKSKLLTPEEAEKERVLKESIKEAIATLSVRKYFHKVGDLPFYDAHRGELMKSDDEGADAAIDYSIMNDVCEEAAKLIEKSFQTLVECDSHPLVEREVIVLAKQFPHLFVQHLAIYAGAGWAEMVVSEVARQEPKEILGRVKEFYKCDWAKNIVAQIAKANPALAFSEIGNYEYMPWAEEIAMIAADLDAEAAISNYEKYRDQPWAKKVLQFVRDKENGIITAAAEEVKTSKINAAIEVFSRDHNGEDELNAFKTFAEYQGDERVVAAVNMLVESHAESFLNHHDLYRTAVWGEEVTKKLTACSPRAEHNLLLERHYGKKFTYEEVSAALDYAIVQDDGRIFAGIINCMKDFRGIDLRGRVEDLVVNDPAFLIRNFETFRSEPWIENMMQIVAPKLSKIKDIDLLKKAVTIYSRYARFRGNVWADNVCGYFPGRIKKMESEKEEEEWRTLVRQNPTKAISDMFSTHVGKPWAKKVLGEAIKSDKATCMMIYVAVDNYAMKSWGKELYLDIIRLYPEFVLECIELFGYDWFDRYGWDDELADTVAGCFIQKGNDAGSNKLIKFCLDNPWAKTTRKFISRLKIMNPEFAKLLKTSVLGHLGKAVVWLLKW